MRKIFIAIVSCLFLLFIATTTSSQNTLFSSDQIQVDKKCTYEDPCSLSVNTLVSNTQSLPIYAIVTFSLVNEHKIVIITLNSAVVKIEPGQSKNLSGTFLLSKTVLDNVKEVHAVVYSASIKFIPTGIRF
jgi:hypothetical protein